LSRKFGLAIAAALVLTNAMEKGVITGTVWAICLTVLTCFYCIGQGIAEIQPGTVVIQPQTSKEEAPK
jgi:hypothetical protein